MTTPRRKLAAGRCNRLPSIMEMSAKPTLVVHSRRTDEADGDGSFGARADRLRRESATSACECTSGAARKSAGGRTGEVVSAGKGARSASARGSVSFQDAKRKTQLCNR